jgi:hypothetical protein
MSPIALTGFLKTSLKSGDLDVEVLRLFRRCLVGRWLRKGGIRGAFFVFSDPAVWAALPAIRLAGIRCGVAGLLGGERTEVKR